MPFGHVTADGIVGAGLVGQKIRNDAALGKFWDQIGAVADQSDGGCFAFADGIFENAQSFVEAGDHDVAVAALHAALDALRIDINAEKRRAVHRCGERLRPAHAAHAAGYDEFASQVAAKMFSSCCRKRFVSALQNSLRADVNPASRGHLAVHHQTGAVEFAEFLPIVPVAGEIGVAKKEAGRIFMGAENRDGLARLHQQRLIGFERLQRTDDGMEAFPVARGFSSAAINDQIFRLLGNFRVEITH